MLNNEKKRRKISNSYSKRKISYKGASYAGIAQSVSQASQNAVDLFRNDSIIKATAMGKAYQKLLSNPSENTDTYFEIINTAGNLAEELKALDGILSQFTGSLFSLEE